MDNSESYSKWAYSFFSSPVPNSNPIIDGEHLMLVGILNALCYSLEASKPAEEIGLIMQKLVTLSESHFTTEELQMRLNSYEGLPRHFEEHQGMLNAYQAMLQHLEEGKLKLLADQARFALSNLLNHIDTSDRHFFETNPRT